MKLFKHKKKNNFNKEVLESLGDISTKIDGLEKESLKMYQFFLETCTDNTQKLKSYKEENRLLKKQVRELENDRRSSIKSKK